MVLAYIISLSACTLLWTSQVSVLTRSFNHERAYFVTERCPPHQAALERRRQRLDGDFVGWKWLVAAQWGPGRKPFVWTQNRAIWKGPFWKVLERNRRHLPPQQAEVT